MLKLSRLVTIAPSAKIVDEELARELNRRFGRPAFPIKVPKIAYGVGFAFGTPGRVKATGFTDAERDRIEAQMGKTIADLELEANALFEYWLLSTPRSLRDKIPGFEPVSTRQDAAAELAEIQVMVDSLHSDKEIATRRRRPAGLGQASFLSETAGLDDDAPSKRQCREYSTKPNGRAGWSGR
jgi:hypothetical protein